MYRIATLPIDSNGMYAEVESSKRTKKAAIKEYWEQIRNAWNGETVICYNNDMMKDYEDLMPDVVVRKKVEARHGDQLGYEDVFPGSRKRYLKYKYLGKIS